MIVVGGTYSEICFEPIWENIFGSGFRAVNLILEHDEARELEKYGNTVLRKPHAPDGKVLSKTDFVAKPI